MLLLAVLFLPHLILFPVLLSSRFSPVLATVAWIIFGLIFVWIGSRLPFILHPERWAYQRIIERYNLLVRQVSDQEILLDRMAHLLYQNLGLEHLSIWRYQSENGLLILSRQVGTNVKQADTGSEVLTELPLDLSPQQLQGAWPVSALPESALRQGLLASGVQLATSLSLGHEVIGLLGLGSAHSGRGYNSETLRWLDWLSGQLALAVKNAYLITDLEETLTKLQLAYRRTVEAEAEERRRLAVELHDDVLSRLTTMTLTLRNSQRCLASEPVQVQNWLEMLEQETQSLNRRLREITQGLHPSVLVDLGLIAALQAYMDSLARRSLPDSAPHTITLTAQGFAGDRLAAPNLERDLYYITRQALDNAIMHAQAEQVFLHLRWREDAISLTVQDTGRGMKDKPEQLMGLNGHLGLLSMNERALARRGRLTFQTNSGRGTTVHVHIPIDQPSPAPTHLQAFTHRLRRVQPEPLRP